MQTHSPNTAASDSGTPLVRQPPIKEVYMPDADAEIDRLRRQVALLREGLEWALQSKEKLPPSIIKETPEMDDWIINEEVLNNA